MAVRAARLAVVTRTVTAQRRAEIKYSQAGQVWTATKLALEEFDESHRQAVMSAYLTPERELAFGVPGWKSVWIGAGEEKVVYLVIDHHNRAFALEVLSKGSYLAGHLAEGHYFGEFQVPGLAHARWDCRSLCGHVFSGEVKAREFIYGETLAGPGTGEEPVSEPSPLKRLVSWASKIWVSSVASPRRYQFRRTYKDAHDGNIMIELIPLNNPEKKNHYFFPVLWLEEDGHLRLRYYRLTPIDVRAR